MDGSQRRKEVPAEFARAGEARHFVSWRAAIAGLGGGRLGELAVAAEAALTDIFLSVEGGALFLESEHDGESFKMSIRHPRIPERRMSGLTGILDQFLDGYELAPTKTVLVKHLR